MAYRTRIKYTAEQKAEMLDRWQRGESLKSIGRVFDRPSGSIFGQLAPSGGIRPSPRQRSRLAVRGNVVPMRTPIVCLDSISQKELTYRYTVKQI
jgi:hypothetical protein